VSFNVFGGDGNDTLTANCATGIDLSAHSTLTIGLYGGLGNDTLEASYSGKLDGRLNLVLSGDAGADTLDARVTLRPVSYGTFEGTVHGGADNDSLAFRLYDYSFGRARIYRPTMNGGTGTDRTRGHTANIAVLSVEQTPFSPSLPPAFGGTVVLA
jgi:hypothetical protein